MEALNISLRGTEHLFCWEVPRKGRGLEPARGDLTTGLWAFTRPPDGTGQQRAPARCGVLKLAVELGLLLRSCSPCGTAS